MRLLRASLAAFLAALAASVLHAQAAPVRLDSLLDAQFAAAAQADSPGCQVAVFRRGQVLAQRVYGSANLEHRVPVTAETRFAVASISKQFTAFAVLLLARDGKLSLDDDVRRYLPEVPDFGRTITVGHLLHHTSGLRDYWDLRGFAGRRNDDVVTEHDVLEFVSRQRALNFAPGTEMLYNNTGYILLGMVVKRVSGMPLAAFAAERIFRPLGMTRTAFVESHQQVVPGRAYGYAHGRGGTTVVAMPASDVVGSSGLVTTAADLAAWDRNFYTGEVGGPGVVAEMRMPARLADGTTAGYGGGLYLGSYRGLRTEEHNGADPGYLAEILRFPDSGITIAGLCSGRAANPIGAARAVADVLLADQIAAAARSTPPAAAREALTRPGAAVLARYAGLYHGTSNDLVRRIVVRGDSLFYSRRPGDETRLDPLADDRFVLGGSNGVEVRFAPAARGNRPEMLVLVPGAPPSRYVPVDSARGLPARLAEYSGVYRSEELQATYRIGILDGELHWRIDGLGPDEFSVTFPPRFQDSFGENGVSLTFVRDRRGRVIALELTTERARRVRFERVGDPVR